MCSEPLTCRAFLGSGGNSPHLAGCDDARNAPRTLLNLPAGHSVYALDVDWVSRQIVAGTRRGALFLANCDDATTADEPSRHTRLVQGAALLAVCLVGRNMLVSSDTSGRCLFWQYRDGDDSTMSARTLPAADTPICALMKVTDDRVVGLSIEGQLIVWSIPDGEIVKTVRGLKPPGKQALVNLVPWPARNALVYPGHDGRLVVFDLITDEVTANQAHMGPFYMSAVWGDRLVTAGTRDGMLKVWRPGSSEQVRQYEIPRGVVNGAVVCDDTGQLILVFQDGHAAVYELANNGVHLRRTLDDRDCRVAVSPTPLHRKEFAKQARYATAQRLSNEIRQAIDHNETACVESNLVKLTDLGFGQLALGLQTRLAVSQKDLVAELKARRRLAGLLPSDDRRSARSLRAYAAVLERSWRLVEACEAYETLNGHYGDDPVATGEQSATLARLKRCASAMAEHRSVFEPDIALTDAIAAATAIRKPFVGRWLIRTLRAIPVGRGQITAQAIASRYELVRSAAQNSDLPHAEAQELLWISRNDVRAVDTVCVGDALSETDHGLQLALQVRHNGIQTIVLPALLFNVVERRSFHPQHNEQAMQAAQQLAHGALTDAWQRQVLRCLLAALSRLQNQAMVNHNEITGAPA